MTLRECPFCGSNEMALDANVPGGLRYSVICNSDDCEARGPKSRSPTEAKDRWNDREPEFQDPRDMGWVGDDGLP